MIVLPVDILASGRRDRDLFPDAPMPDSELLAGGYHPPVLVRASDELVLWGWSVIRVAEKLGLEELPVAYFEGSREDEYAIALRLEARTDRFSFRERELLLNAAVADQIAEETFERVLGPHIVSDGPVVSVTRRFAALEPTLKRVVCDRLIDLKSAERVAAVPPGVVERALAATAFRALSFSRRRQFFGLMAEIAIREPERLAQIVDAALESESPEKYLTERRYPRLTEYTNRFDRSRTQIERGSGLRIRAPEYFEGASYRLEIPFSSREELVERLDRARKIEGYCDELFSLLQ
ncbi:MAG TPA: hypothetical protein VMW87_13110 [Spirochaetia bacterium]|nr:hypothetical protein [Spirochaetia bacterium]